MDTNRQSITLKLYHLISCSGNFAWWEWPSIQMLHISKKYLLYAHWIKLINDHYTQPTLTFINKPAVMKSSNMVAQLLFNWTGALVEYHDTRSHSVECCWNTWLKKKNLTPQMTMSNVKFTHKKTISYQKVISTRNPFSNITARRQRSLAALRAYTLLLPGEEGQTLRKRKEMVDL